MPSLVNILGVGVNAQTLTNAVARIAAWVTRRERTYVCVTNVHVVVESQTSPKLKDALNGAGMVTTDGMPLVWLCRWAGHGGAGRVYGPDLMLALCAHSVEAGWRHAFFGANDAVLARLRTALEARFPGLTIVEALAPPYRPATAEEDVSFVGRLNSAAPDIIWVGLGAPKQELWMATHRDRLTAPVLIGVGAAFDFLAGAKRQAPTWMQQRGLEWLFRLSVEPRRLLRRYAVTNSLFLWYLGLAACRLRRPALPTGVVRSSDVPD